MSLREGQIGEELDFCGTHVSKLLFSTCGVAVDNCAVVDASLNRAGTPTPPIVYNIAQRIAAMDYSFLMDSIANRFIHIAPSSSTTSSTSPADRAFDELIRELWQSHVKALGTIGASKGWGGSYWQKW